MQCGIGRAGNHCGPQPDGPHELDGSPIHRAGSADEQVISPRALSLTYSASKTCSLVLQILSTRS